MRKIVFMLIGVPVLLLSMFAGANISSNAGEQVEVPTTMQDESTAPVAKPFIPMVNPAIPFADPDPTVPETTPPVTEPPVTEPDGPKLISLGTFRLTAYCSCQKCCGEYALNRPVDENGDEIVYGSIGVRLEAGISIAVDPRVIPYMTQVVINGHTYTAHDTGGAIKGNRIDVYFDNHEDAWDFGVQYAEVFVYVEAN